MRFPSALRAVLATILACGCGATVRSAVDDRTDAAAPGDSGFRDSASTASDAIAASDTTSPAGDQPVARDTSPPLPDAPSGPCAAGDLCLQPRTPIVGTTLTSGRLGVVWVQFNDDGPDPDPEVAYDVPFGGSAAQANVPLAAIAPPGDAVLFCARACNDEASCRCIGGPRIGIAYVVVAVDADANGRINLTERGGGRADPIVATGFLAIVLSPEAMAVASAPLDMLFTRGLARGVAPYPLVPRDMSDHALGPPTFGRIYDLNFCPPENRACAPFVPNLN